MNIYEINAEYKKVIDECRVFAEEHKGELSPELTVKLDHYQMELDNKIRNFIHYFKNEYASYYAIQNEIDILSRRAKVHENNFTWAKTWLASIVTPDSKIEYPTGKISWKKSSSVGIVDVTKIPDIFMRIIPEKKEPDKMAIKDELKAGKIVEGCELIESQNIQIK